MVRLRFLLHCLQVFFLSSRVHPGETPSSFVFNGFLDFILRDDDARAVQLRRQYVFKLVPMLNPDGVVRGHYRTDARGVNLNRVYLNPSFELHPSVYAVKSILVFHHINNRTCGGAGDVYPTSNVWVPNVPQETVTVTAEVAACDLVKLPSSADMLPSCSAIVNPSESPVVLDTECTDHSISKTSVHCGSVGSGDDVESLSELNSATCELVQDTACAASASHSQRDFGMFVVGCNSTASCNEAASGGECEDFDDDTGQIGNEGSDDDDEEDSTQVIEIVHSPHLSDPLLRTVTPTNSGIAFYIDLHAHASKRGCFMYGNYLEDDDAQTDNVLFARLVAINSAHFDFEACNFTERNMYSTDRKEGLSKEGSGRVALYKTLGIRHWYGCVRLSVQQWSEKKFVGLCYYY